MIDSGRLRHHIRFELLEYELDSNGDTYQDPVTGEPRQIWTVFAEVPASIEPLRTKQLIAAQAIQSEVTAIITIRFIDGLTVDMRIRYIRGDGFSDILYTPLGFQVDTDSGFESITIPCKVLEQP